MFSIATDAAPGRPNEDFVVVTPEAAVIVDGAGIPFGGCEHGVVWYARQLGIGTMAALVHAPNEDLRLILRAGIEYVVGRHKNTCDLTNPGTPCAAVGILRIGKDTVDTLALSDVSVVVDTDAGPIVTCDLAIEELSGTEPDAVRGRRFGTPEHAAAIATLVAKQTATRNREDGWWCAAAAPEAADYALVRSVARADVRRVAIMSDGASRPVDQLNSDDWPSYLDRLAKIGPAEMLRYVREIETDDPDGVRHPRTKRHDDAALAFADLSP
ncbi:hypothetical protein AB0I28_09640 [Phytomonospora sp. NPDC050363]|uniref:hypothetical protein n=1 Tax=Phytomonospora sp. NPDC050363 TaxID=3155642 RepID=UPI0033F7E49F